MEMIINKRITDPDGMTLVQTREWMLRHWQDTGREVIAEVTYNGTTFQERIKSTRAITDIWSYVRSHCRSKGDNIRLKVFQRVLGPPNNNPKEPIIKSLFARRKKVLT